MSEMAPLYFFLASSLNTELVYIILKSVSQFTYLLHDIKSQGCCRDTQLKVKSINMVQVKGTTSEDASIRLSKIKIK